MNCSYCSDVIEEYADEGARLGRCCVGLARPWPRGRNGLYGTDAGIAERDAEGDPIAFTSDQSIADQNRADDDYPDDEDECDCGSCRYGYRFEEEGSLTLAEYESLPADDQRWYSREYGIPADVR